LAIFNQFAKKIASNNFYTEVVVLADIGNQASCIYWTRDNRTQLNNTKVHCIKTKIH